MRGPGIHSPFWFIPRCGWGCSECQSSFSTPNSSNRAFVGIALCTGPETKKCLPQTVLVSWSVEIFLELRGPGQHPPPPKKPQNKTMKQHHSIIFSPPIFEVSTMQSAACFTPLHLMIGIVLDDVRLGCRCSAMEAHAMKFLVHSLLTLMPEEAWSSAFIESADSWQLLHTLRLSNQQSRSVLTWSATSWLNYCGC